jgi:hypothetical protein
MTIISLDPHLSKCLLILLRKNIIVSWSWKTILLHIHTTGRVFYYVHPTCKNFKKIPNEWFYYYAKTKWFFEKKISFIMTNLTLGYGSGYFFNIIKKSLWPEFGNKCCVSFTSQFFLMCVEFTCFALLRGGGSFRILQMLFIQFEANK